MDRSKKQSYIRKYQEARRADPAADIRKYSANALQKAAEEYGDYFKTHAAVEIGRTQQEQRNRELGQNRQMGSGKSSKEDFLSAYRAKTAASAVPADLQSPYVEQLRQERKERSEFDDRILGRGIDTKDGWLSYSAIKEAPDYGRTVQAGRDSAAGAWQSKQTGAPGSGLYRTGLDRMTGREQDLVSAMTEEEQGNYYYLYGKYGRSAAEQYRDSIRSELNGRYTKALQGYMRGMAAEHPVQAVLLDAGTQLYGVQELPEVLGRTAMGETVDPNDPLFSVTAAQEALHEGIAENETLERVIPNQGLREFLTGTGLSITENLARLPLKDTGLLVAGMNAGSSGVRDALQRGASGSQAAAEGLAYGIAEAFFEKFSLEGLDRFKPGNVNSVKDFLKNIGKQMFTEGSEEVATEFANTVSDQFIMGELSDYSLNKQNYMDQGMDESEAQRAALWDVAKQFGLAFAGGALSGGVMGGSSQAVNTAADYALTYGYGRSVNPDYRDYMQGISRVTERFGSEADAQRALDLRRTAEEYAARQAAGESVSPYERGQYQRDIDNYLDYLAYRDAQRMARETSEQGQETVQQSGAETGSRQGVRDFIMRPWNAVRNRLEGNTGRNMAGAAGNSQERSAGAQETDARAGREKGMAADGKLPQETAQIQETEQAQESERMQGTEQAQEIIQEPGEQEQETVSEAPAQADERDAAPRKAGKEQEPTTARELAEQEYSRIMNGEQEAGNAARGELEVYAERFGEAGRAAFMEAYDTTSGVSPESYYRAFSRFYDSQRYGTDAIGARAAASRVLLTDAQIEAAEAAGMKDYDAAAETGRTEAVEGVRHEGGLETDSPLATDAQRKVAAAVGRRTGLKIHLDDSLEAMGAYGRGEIRISVNEDDFLGTVAHELTHFIKEYAADSYAAYETVAMNVISRSQETDAEDLIDSYRRRYAQAGQELTRDQLVEEIVADAAQEFLSDPEFVNETVRADRSLARRILDFLDDVIDAVRSLVRKGTLRKAARALKEDLEGLIDARDLWARALGEAADTYRGGASADVSEGENGRYRLARPDQVTDEQIEENYQAVREMEPVAELTGEEFAKADGTIKEQVGRFFDSIGNVAHNDVVGDVILNLESIRDDIAHGVSRNKVASYMAVPDVIRNGHVLDYSGQRVVMGAKVIMGGEEYFELCIATVNQENRLYLHEVCAIKTDENAPFWTKAAKSRRLSGASHPSTMSIFKKLIFVNGAGENNETDVNKSEGNGDDSAKGFRYQLDGVDVEEMEDKNLVAIHNLSEEKLLNNLELGGFPAPSIAIGKADVGHEGYGDISVVFRKETIDPQADRRNHVFGADAYTPRFPQIDYAVNEGEAKKLADRVGMRESYLEANVLDGNDPERAAKRMEGLHETKETYLREKGIRVEPVAHMPSMSYINSGNGAKQFLARPDVTFDGILRDADMRREYVAGAVQGLKQGMAAKRTDTLNRRLDRCLIDQEEYDKNLKLFEKDMRIARGEAEPQLDQYSYEEGVDNAIAEHRDDYQKHVRDLLAPAFGDKYIRNSRERLTGSGRSRSFKELHYPYTLENIVRAMNEGEGIKNRASGLMSGAGEIRAAVSRNLDSIEDIRSESARIQNLSSEEIGEVYGKMDRMMMDIMRDLSSMSRNENNFMTMNNASSVLVEAYGAGKARQKIRSVIEGYYGKIPDELMDRVMQLREYAAQIPVKYFEAKPMRPIGMDEVAAVVLPETSSEKLKDRLAEAGVKTVEYDPDEPGARKRAVGNLEGVRFQLDGVDDYESQINDLLHENEELRSANEMLKREFELTSKDAVRMEDIHKVTGKLLRRYNSTMNQDVLDRNVSRLYEYIRSADRIDGQELARVAADIARGILNQAQQKDTALTEQYKDERRKIRETRITLDKADRLDLAQDGGYNEFRRKYFGRIRLVEDGMSVDSFYEELAGDNPEWFKLSVTHPADRLRVIAGFLEATDAQVRNPYHADMEEMSYLVGQELLDEYYSVRAPKATFADRQAQEAARIRRDYSRRMAEYKRKLETRYDALLAERDREMMRAKDVHIQELQVQREKYEKRMQKRRDAQRKQEAKKRIMKEVTSMRRWLLTPTDKKHIPQELRAVTADFLAQLDFSSARDVEGAETQTQRTQLWKDVKKQLDAIVDAGGKVTDDDGITRYVDLDPDLQERFGQIMQKVEGVGKLDELDAYSMEELLKTVQAMKKAVTEVDVMKANSRYHEVSVLSEEAIREMRGLKEKTELRGPMAWPGNMLNYEMLDPLTMFSQVGPAFETLYDGLRDGLDRKTRHLREAEHYFKKVLEDTGLSGQDVRKLTGVDAETKTFRLSHGSIRLSVGQIMGLYELEKRGQAAKHIYDRQGGIKPSERAVGFHIGRDGIRIPQFEKEARPVRVSQAEVRQITDSLTQQQKQLADAVQQFLAGQATAWGNETSMEMYGYEKFVAKDYYPIRTDKHHTYKTEDARKAEQTVSIKDLGFTKATNPHANNPVIIEDIFDVFTRHVDQMSSYNAYVAPLSDLGKVMGYQALRGDSDSVSTTEELERAFGKAGKAYIERLEADINGSVRGDGESRLLSSFKAASVAGNLRVAIQQPTAIARAYAEIDSKYLLKGVVSRGSGKWDLILEYAPIAQWKDWGFYRMQTSRQLKDILVGSDSAKQRFVEKTMFLASKGDEIAWVRLWNACEAETEERHPELERGSREFYERVGKRFSGIVDRTQVADSVLHRTQIMRRTDNLTKMATAFMGEPLKTYNMLYRSVMDVRREMGVNMETWKANRGKEKADRTTYRTKAARKMTRSAAAFVANAALTAFAASVLDAMRDPDRDKDWMEKYQENVRQNFLDNMNLLNSVPYVKEIPSVIEGYTPARTDLSAFTDIRNALVKLGQLRSGTGKLTAMAVLGELAQSVSKATGVPVKNILRDAGALMDTVMNITGGQADYEWMRARYDIALPANRTMYAGMILDARDAGNGKLAERIKEDMKKAGWSADEVKEAMNSEVNKEMKAAGIDIIAAADACSPSDRESMQAFGSMVDAYIEYKSKIGWDEGKCLAQIRSSLTGKYKPKYLAAKTVKEREAVLQKLRSLSYKGKGLYDGYDFTKWKQADESGDEWDF